MHSGFGALPLLAFQHHVGAMYIAPEEIELVCALGIGDLAVVEQGRWHRPDGSIVNVVVKGWKPDVIATPQDFREMLLEASKLQRLQHPNVTHFLGLGCFSHGSLAEVRESMFMVEEFVSTRTLRKLIGEQMRCRLKNLYDMRAALRWAAEVAAALAALHEQQPPYIHGDLKADNVFFTDSYDVTQSHVKIGDLKPHRHVYDRAPSMLSQHQQHQQQNSRQASLARFTLERISNSNCGSGHSSWTSMGSASNARCFLDSAGGASDGNLDSSGCDKDQQLLQQQGWALGRQQLQQQLGSSKSCLEPESPWMAAAAEGDVGCSDSSMLGPGCRVFSMPVPILRSGTCHSGVAGGGPVSFDSARDARGFSALESSYVGSCPGPGAALAASRVGGDLQQQLAAGSAAAGLDAPGSGEDAAAAARWRLGRRLLGLSDSASSTSGSDGSVGICKAKLGFVTLADATHQDYEEEEEEEGGSASVLLQLQQRAAAEAAAAAATVAASEHNGQQQQQRWRWLYAGSGGGDVGSTDKQVHGLRCRSRSLPQQEGLDSEPEEQQQVAAAALLVTSKSAPASILAREAAPAEEPLQQPGKEGKVRAGRAMRASQLLMQQQETHEPAAVAAVAAAEGRSKLPGLLQRQLSAGDTASRQQPEQQAPEQQQQQRVLDSQPSLMRQASLERQQQRAAGPDQGGWELSPSGAASPCGSVQCGLLDLFADMTEDDVIYNRRRRDVSVTQYALMPGSLVQHRLQPAASQLRAFQSWDHNTSISGAGSGVASFASLPADVGNGGSSAFSGAAAAAAAAVAAGGAPAAARAACKGSAPSAIESKQHGGNSAFAALTAIDCITEETSSIATDSVIGSCATSRESTAHGGSHYYQDADSSHSGSADGSPGDSAGNALHKLPAVSAAAAAAGLLGRSFSPATPQQRSAFGMSAVLPVRSRSGSGCSLEGVRVAASGSGSSGSSGPALEQLQTPAEAATAGHSSSRSSTSTSAGGSDSPKQQQQSPQAAATAAAAASPGQGKRVRFTVERPAGSTPSRDFGLLYTAPELLKGQRPTEKIDVFAFGVLLHELLSRQLVVSQIASVCAAANSKHSRSRNGVTGSRHGGSSHTLATDTSSGEADTAAAAGGSSWDAPDALPEQQMLLSFAQLVADGYRLPFPAHFPESARSLISACWAAEPHQRPRMADVLLQLQELAGDKQAVMSLNSYLAGLADMGYGGGAGGGGAVASCGCTGGCVIC